MNKKTLAASIVFIVVVLLAAYFAFKSNTTPAGTDNNQPQAQSTTTPVVKETFLPYGDVSLRLGEIAVFKDVSIRPIAILEDSRCPVDVQCIQAGTVSLKIEILSSSGTNIATIKMGENLKTETKSITFLGVMPNKNSKVTFPENTYVLSFNVVERDFGVGSKD